jgi:hypothetical protein
MDLGTAMIVRSSNGIPMLPARAAEAAARNNRNSILDQTDVVIVTEDPELARGIFLPWARIAGVITEQPQANVENRGCPSVSGIANLLEIVADETLILVDGDRGIVLVDPDAAAIAGYQAERERIAPRKRIFVDFAHQPAHTTDGRQIHVIAGVSNLQEAEQAVELGADGLLLRADCGLFMPDASDDEHLRSLISVVDLAGGKPITVAGNLEALSARALLRASIRGDITFALTMDNRGGNFEPALAFLDETKDALIDQEIEFGEPRFAASLDLSVGKPDLEGFPISRIVVQPAMLDGRFSIKDLQAIDRLTADAARTMVPVEVVLPNSDEECVEIAIGLGAAGVVVGPEEITRMKEHIREVDTTLCRSQLYAPPIDEIK